jgi:hypothetical protein
VNANTIGQLIAETRQLLQEQGREVRPTSLRFDSAPALTEFITNQQRELPARSRNPYVLSDPKLTGMPRAEFANLTERIRSVLASRNERHRYRRRGGERLPGARGGVFRQKITDDERVLATVLHQRRVCNQEALAALFEVSRSTIRDVVREVGPLLAQEGCIPTRAPTRFGTAKAVLDSVATGRRSKTPS